MCLPFSYNFTLPVLPKAFATPGTQVDIKHRPHENYAPSSEAAWDAGILPAQPEVMIMLRKEMGSLADPSDGRAGSCTGGGD